MRRALFTLLILTIPLGAIWRPQIDLDGRFGGFREGGGITYFHPLQQSGGGLTFGQVALNRYDSVYTGSVGLGYRQAVNCNFAWGVNAFGDLARSSNNDNYYQGGLGAELMGPWWVVRANGYLPRTRCHTLEQSSFTRLEPNNTFVQVNLHKTEQAYWGGDVEVGTGFGLFSGELWGYAAFLGYDAPKRRPVYGPRFRIDYVVNDPYHWGGVRARIGGEWRYDHLHNGQLTLTVGLTVPLCRPNGKRRCPTVCDRMADPVYRQRGMWVLENVRRQESVIPSPFRIFFVDSVGGGTGTQEDPFNLDMAQAAADQPGDVIVLLNDRGPIVNTLNPYQLLSEQQLGGFLNNPSLTVTVDGIPIVIPNLMNSGPAQLVGVVGLDQVNLQGGNNVFGFHTTLGNRALSSSAAASSVIREVTLSAFSDTGIFLDNQTSAVIDKVTISQTVPNSDGIGINNSSNVSITGSTLVGLPGAFANLNLDTVQSLIIDGVTAEGGSLGLVANDVNTVTVSNSSFENHIQHGISVEDSQDWNLSNVQSNTNEFGLDLARVTNASVSGSTFNQNLVAGIVLEDNEGTLSFAGSEVVDNVGFGVQFNPSSAPAPTYTFSDNQITSSIPASTLISVNDTDATTLFQGGTLRAVGTVHGILATNTPGTWTFNNVDFQGTTLASVNFVDNSGILNVPTGSISPLPVAQAVLVTLGTASIGVDAAITHALATVPTIAVTGTTGGEVSVSNFEITGSTSALGAMSGVSNAARLIFGPPSGLSTISGAVAGVIATGNHAHLELRRTQMSAITTTGVSAVAVAGESLSGVIYNNVFDSALRAIDLSASVSGTLAFNVQNNTISNVPALGAGASVTVVGGAASSVNALYSGNTFTNVPTTASVFTLNDLGSLAGATTTIELEGNVATNVTGEGMVATSAGLGTLNLTFDSNSILAVPTVVTDSAFGVTALTGTNCVTIEGNSTDRIVLGQGINLLGGPLNPINVHPSATAVGLNGANPGIATSSILLLNVTPGPACPTPTVPPIP